MKRKSNKLISLLLALTMMVNVLPLGVWADEGDTTIPPTEEEQQMDQLSETDENESDTNNENENTPDANSDNKGSGKSGEQEEQVYTDGLWEFTLNPNGFAIIKAYTGTSSDVNIPQMVSADGQNREVRFIGASAFAENTTIVNVTLPDTVKNIGPSAFEGCTTLTSITIPENVSFIGQNAFSGCSGLTITYLGTQSQWESIEKGDNAVSGININPIGIEWEYTYNEETNRVTIDGIVNNTIGEYIEIPARLEITVDGEKKTCRVTIIAANAFQGKTTLKEVTLPETIQEIGDNAFAGCTSLEKINFEGTKYQWNQVKEGENAIPDGVKINCAPEKYVNDWAYELEGKNELIITGYKGTSKDVTIPEKLTVDSEERTVVRIGSEAFRGKDITSVVIPNSVEELETGVFNGCTSLASVTLSDNLEIIGRGAFRGCESLTSIILPASVKTIKNEAFLDSGLTIIAYCGEGKSQLNLILNVDKSGNLTGDNGISDCWIVAFDKDLMFLAGYKGEFVDDEVTLPTEFNGEIITHIGGQAFAERDDVTKLSIPEGYEHIRPDAFRECPNLTEIKLPLSLRGIMGLVFEGCDKIEKVFYAGSEPQWEELDISSNAFEPFDIDDMIEEGIIQFGTVAEYDLSGIVKDGAGKPISGATVTLTYDGKTESVTTEENGAYLFENLSYKYEYTLTATAAGYANRSVTMELEEDTVYDFLFYKKGNAEGELYLAHLIETEIHSFNPTLNSNVQNDRGNQLVFANTLSGLVELDADNKVIPALAVSIPQASGDSTSWTFTVKDNIPWVDVNGNIVEDAEGNPIYVTAEDFETTYDLMSNRGTNPELYSSSLMLEYIESVTVNGNSITFELKKSAENFPYLLAASDFFGFYPMSQKMLNQTDGNINNRNMWYCGPYLLADYVKNSYKVYVPNEFYWDRDAELFEKITVTMVGDYAEAFELFEAGQLDYVEINGDIAQELIDKGSTYSEHLVSKMLKPYSYQMHWNFSKRDPDTQTGTDENDARPEYASAENWNKAIANEDFRLSLYYGMELSNYYALMNPVDPLSCENNTNSLVGTIFTTNGTDYTELVKGKLGIDDYDGKVMVRYNKTKADDHKDKAIEALKGEVTFPVSIDYYVKDGNERQEEFAAILRYCLNRSLGDDYVTVNILTYDDSLSKEVRDPQFHSLAINGWGNDYSDPYNNLAQYILTDNKDAESGDPGYFSVHWNNSTDLDQDHPVKQLLAQYTTMLNDADNITNSDERLAALSEAEAYLISNGLVTPCYLGMGYCIGYIAPDSMISDIMKDWDVRTDLVPGGEIHDNGITDYGVWKPKDNDVVFDWIVTDDGILYITGNGSLEGVGNNGNTPWQKYKNDIKRIIVSPAVTGLNETGAFKELDRVTNVEFGEYTGRVPSVSTYNLSAETDMEIQTYSILETIGKSTFEGCTSLESIKIPTSVETIGENAFADTGLTKINYAGDSEEFAEIDGCDDFLFDTYQNLEGEHQFADQNSDNGINIADVDLLYRKAQ